MLDVENEVVGILSARESSKASYLFPEVKQQLEIVNRNWGCDYTGQKTLFFQAIKEIKIRDLIGIIIASMILMMFLIYNDINDAVYK